MTHLTVARPRRYGLDPDGFIEITDETLPVVFNVREDTPHNVVARHFAFSLQGSLIHLNLKNTIELFTFQFAMFALSFFDACTAMQSDKI